MKFGVVVFRVCMLDWWWGDHGKFGVVVLKASMLDLGVDLPVHLQFGIAVFKACMLDWWWGRSGKFGVVVLKASMPDWQGGSASMCQVWCSGIEGMYA